MEFSDLYTSLKKKCRLIIIVFSLHDKIGLNEKKTRIENFPLFRGMALSMEVGNALIKVH